MTGPQSTLIEDIRSNRLFSLASEIRAGLYIGALFLIAGVGATVRQYFAELGPISILSFLTAGVAASIYYCFTRGLPYDPTKVESPNVAFDYVLYLGCAFLGVEFGYLETHYHLLADWWDLYLLFSSCLFFYLAYRFDNRFVVAMALINLGAWLGVRMEAWHVQFISMRTRAILYGLGVVAGGAWVNAQGIKTHFLDTYLNVGLHVLFWALLSGLSPDGFLSPYFFALIILSALVLYYAFHQRRFQYFLYAVTYAYLGVTYCIFKDMNFFTDRYVEALSFYLLISSTVLIWVIFHFRKTLAEKS